MVKALCFALVAALCLGLALSLNCYNCTTTGENCMAEAMCNAAMNETYCRVTAWKMSDHTMLMKSCGTNCSAGNMADLHFFSCCNTDLCNKQGASGSVRVSASGVSLALGVSAMLTRLLL